MDTPPETTDTLRLSTAEMAFMLAWLEVPRLIGGDQAALFPADPEVRNALLAQGKAELQAAGRIVWDETYRTYHPNEALVALCIGVAVPELVVIGNTQTTDGTTGGITYAFTDSLIVELTLQAQTYILRPIASAAVVAECLCTVLQLPVDPAVATHQTHQIPNTLFQALRQQQPLEAAEAAAHLPPHLSTAITQAVRASFVVLLTVDQGAVTANTELGILNTQAGQAWLVAPQPPNLIHLQPTNATTFTALLTEQITARLSSTR